MGRSMRRKGRQRSARTTMWTQWSINPKIDRKAVSAGHATAGKRLWLRSARCLRRPGQFFGGGGAIGAQLSIAGARPKAPTPRNLPWARGQGQGKGKGKGKRGSVSKEVSSNVIEESAASIRVFRSQ